MSSGTVVESGQLSGTTRKMGNSSFLWKKNVDSINGSAKRLRKISKEHDDCLSGDISKMEKLSSQLDDIKADGYILYDKMITAIAAYAAIEKNKMSYAAREQLTYANDSKKGGDKYWKLYFDHNVDWCACFVSWCAKQNNIPTDVVTRSPRVDDFYNTAVSKGNFKKVDSGYVPKKGDIIVWKRFKKGDRSHVGIVESYKDGKVTTIEGNINHKKSTKSEVSRVTYDVDENYGGCTGFISVNYKKKNR